MFFNVLLNAFMTRDDVIRANINPDLDDSLLMSRHYLARLRDTPVPTPGDYQRVVELWPTSAPIDPDDPGSGVRYYRQYEVVEMFTVPVTERDFTAGLEVTLTVQQQKDRYLANVLKRGAKQCVTELKNYTESQGVVATNGIPVDTSALGLSRLAITKSRSDSNPTDPVFVPAPGDTSVEATRAEFLTAYTESADFLQTTAELQSFYHGAIDVAADVSSVASISSAVSAAWPSSDLSIPAPSTYVDIALTYDSNPEDLIYMGSPLPKTGPAGPSGQVMEFDLRSLVASPGIALDVVSVNGDTSGSLNLVNKLDVYFKLGKPYIQFDDTVSPGTHSVTIRLTKIGG